MDQDQDLRRVLAGRADDDVLDSGCSGDPGNGTRQAIARFAALLGRRRDDGGTSQVQTAGRQMTDAHRRDRRAIDQRRQHGFLQDAGSVAAFGRPIRRRDPFDRADVLSDHKGGQQVRPGQTNQRLDLIDRGPNPLVVIGRSDPLRF
ncbi:hypothetical protein CKO51_08000 [Rhodopirellula sp. SM50]|nr:hypothetical protein CKO51_08000 [Rhodopirellula sp. SM50]